MSPIHPLITDDGFLESIGIVKGYYRRQQLKQDDVSLNATNFVE